MSENVAPASEVAASQLAISLAEKMFTDAATRMTVTAESGPWFTVRQFDAEGVLLRDRVVTRESPGAARIALRLVDATPGAINDVVVSYRGAGITLRRSVEVLEVSYDEAGDLELRSQREAAASAAN